MAANGLVSSDYAACAQIAVQTAFDQRSALTKGGESMTGGAGNASHVSPAQFTDILALSFRDEAMRRNGASPMQFAVERQNREGDETFVVRSRDRNGSGVNMEVDADFNVRVTPVQGFSNGKQVLVFGSEREYRLNPDARDRMPYVEQRAGSSNGPFVPIFVPGDDRTGDSRVAQVKGVSDNPGQAAGGNLARTQELERTMPPTETLLTGAVRAGSDFFAVRLGVPYALKDGYQQSGHITYDGFSMVEQATGRGPVLYDKAQLAAHARDPANLERELERGAALNGSADLRVAGDQVIDGITRSQALERAHPGHQPPARER